MKAQDRRFNVQAARRLLWAHTVTVKVPSSNESIKRPGPYRPQSRLILVAWGQCNGTHDTRVRQRGEALEPVLGAGRVQTPYPSCGISPCGRDILAVEINREDAPAVVVAWGGVSYRLLLSLSEDGGETNTRTLNSIYRTKAAGHRLLQFPRGGLRLLRPLGHSAG